MPAHSCSAPLCDELIPSSHVYCHTHWTELPFRLKKKLLALISHQQSPEFHETIIEANEALAPRESEVMA